MANRRMINSDMFEDEHFITFDDVTRLVWIGLITKCADDQGRLQDNVLLIKAQLFPADKKTTAKIEQSLEVLVKSGMLTRYEKEGKNLIQINNWWKHQTPSWASPSNYPAPECWVDRVKVHAKGGAIQSLNWDQKGGYVATTLELHSSYVGVTQSIEKVNGDVNGESKGDGKVEAAKIAAAGGEKSEAVAAVSKAYESEIGIITAGTSERIKAAVEEYPAEWITDAISEAVKYNARNWAYVSKVLARWKAQGRTNGNGKSPALAGADVEKYRKLYEQYKQSDTN